MLRDMSIVSKLHASPLVILCKERKENIKAAKYSRYDFATSFEVYLDSLSELGNVLNQYIDQEFIFFDHSCDNFSFSFSDIDSDSDSESSSHNNEFHSEEEESIRSFHCEHYATSPCMNRNNMKNKRGLRFEDTTSEAPFDLSSNNNSNHNSPKMQTSSGNWFFPQQVNQDSFGDPMHEDFGPKKFPYFTESQNHGTEQKNDATDTVSPIPPPPPPQVSSWDFLYPISKNYDIHKDHDDQGEIGRETREGEGIPDLEDVDVDESDRSSIMSVCYQEEMGSGMKHGASNGSSNVSGLNSNNEEFMAWREIIEENIKSNLEPKITPVENSESLGNNSRVTTPVSSCSVSLKEAVLDIKNEFNFLFEFGSEFSSIIEAGKVPYPTVNSKLKAFSCCLSGQIIPSLQTRSYPSYILHQQTLRTRLSSKAKMHRLNYQKYVCGDLSSTLEKLCVWENKLYAEVVGEEKLRISYDKQYKRLKKLDKRGSESGKIDDALASLKLLNSEIHVAVTAISVIAREINVVRDDKLFSELNKLIEGLIRLWKVMSTCHQKQLEAISKAKSHIHILDSVNKKKSSSKATLRLEKMILNWGMCFSNFINTQKALVKHLNDWLMRLINQEAEENEDVNDPLLADDLGAPSIFGICNKWHHAINSISEIEVSKAIRDFALQLHQLYKKLEEEKALKVTVKQLLKDYQHKLKSFCKKRGINSQHYSYFTKMKASEYFVQEEIPLLRVSDDNLTTSSQRLIEQKKRHQQVIRQVNDVASSCFQEGLAPIFDALWIFCLENVKVYEQLRLPNVAPHE